MTFAMLTRGPIDERLLTRQVASDEFGAIVTFAGIVRNHSGGRRVAAIEYHAYESLAIADMERIAAEAETRFRARCAVAHRLGPISIGEAAVAVAAASEHRAEAFDACRFAIDTIKQSSPIWKRGTYDDGAYWIEGMDAIEADILPAPEGPSPDSNPGSAQSAADCGSIHTGDDDGAAPIADVDEVRV